MTVKGEIQGGNPMEMLRQIARPLIEEAGRKVTFRLANRYAGLVRETIIGQQLADKWVPLSPAYLLWKIRMNLDTRLLRATGEYVQSIVVRREDDYYIVKPAERKHEDPRVAREDGPTLKQIGFWLEYGTWTVSQADDGSTEARVKMPARPHWRPVWINFKANLAQHTEEMRRKVWAQVAPRLKVELDSAMIAQGFKKIDPSVFRVPILEERET